MSDKGFAVPKECKIERVAATESTRYSICGVQINAERKSLVATDGRILLELQIDGMNGETTAVVQCDVFKALRKGRLKDRTLSCDGKEAVVSGGASEERFACIEGKFPDAVMILDGVPSESAADVVVGINAKLLARLAEGMGTNGVILRMRTTDKKVITAISVTPSHRDGTPAPDARGAIMPITLT